MMGEGWAKEMFILFLKIYHYILTSASMYMGLKGHNNNAWGWGGDLQSEMVAILQTYK